MASLQLAGKKFGPWTVIEKSQRPEGLKQPGSYWLAQCRCGNREVHSGGRLNAGRFGKGCRLCSSHGHTKGGITPEYQSWRGMRERCTNPNHASYSRYGGRGVKVCSEWLYSFDAFLKDMGPRPKGCSLDRIDNAGNYEPENCRWANAKTQIHNSSGCRLTDAQVSAIRNLLAGGARQIDIAEAVGVSRSHIANIATGWAR